MADTFNKKEREKKKSQRKKEKQARKESRKESPNEGWESMIAYVDENGVIRDTPPDPNAKTEIKAKNIEIGIPRKEDSEEEEDQLLSGTVSFYDDSKGYGFIKAENGESLFVHRNNTSVEPVLGQKVRFEKEKGPRGWVAVKVVPA